jgi:spore coat polysaccharide biosynthesis protein SpsF (cytidylyltransferase family)
MTVTAIIQARMSSSRLPGKVLAQIGGLPSIVFMAQEAGARASGIETLWSRPAPIRATIRSRETLAAHGIGCFRGSLDDVLARFAGAAAESGAQVVVRLTGDCPLIDADIVDQAIALVADQGYDYASNVEQPSFPDGLDVEAFTIAALERTCAAAVLGSDREHVTPYMRRPEAGLKRAHVQSAVDLSALRWTVDYPDDLAFVQSIADALGDASAECGSLRCAPSDRTGAPAPRPGAAQP